MILMFYIQTQESDWAVGNEAPLERGLKTGPDVAAFSGIFFNRTSDKLVSDFLLMLEQLLTVIVVNWSYLVLLDYLSFPFLVTNVKWRPTCKKSITYYSFSYLTRFCIWEPHFSDDGKNELSVTQRGPDSAATPFVVNDLKNLSMAWLPNNNQAFCFRMV